MNFSFAKKPFLLLTISALGLLTACTETAEKIEVSPQGLQKVVANTAEKVIVINIENWQSESVAFQQQSVKFCQSKTPIDFTGLQDRYRSLASAWNQTIMFDFGPLRDDLFLPKIHFVESTRQRGRDYTSSIRSHIQQQLDDDKPLDAAYFSKLKFTLTGMPVFEQLLFAEPTEKQLTTYENPRMCQLLKGYAEYNKTIADYVLTGWKKAEAGTAPYLQQFSVDQLEDGEPAINRLLLAMQDYLRYIWHRKLKKTMLEAPSGMDYKNLQTGLETVAKVFYANGSTHSLANYLQASNNQALVDKFKARYAIAHATIQQKDLNNLKKDYKALIEMFEKEIPKALGVDLGINFADGD